MRLNGEPGFWRRSRRLISADLRTEATMTGGYGSGERQKTRPLQDPAVRSELCGATRLLSLEAI